MPDATISMIKGKWKGKGKSKLVARAARAKVSRARTRSTAYASDVERGHCGVDCRSGAPTLNEERDETWQCWLCGGDGHQSRCCASRLYGNGASAVMTCVEEPPGGLRRNWPLQVSSSLTTPLQRTEDGPAIHSFVCVRLWFGRAFVCCVRLSFQ